MLKIKAKRYRHPLGLISIAVWSCLDSYSDVSERLLYRGIDMSYDTVRQWCLKFGSHFNGVMKRRASKPSDKWHLDEQRLIIYGVSRMMSIMSWRCFCKSDAIKR